MFSLPQKSNFIPSVAGCRVQRRRIITLEPVAPSRIRSPTKPDKRNWALRLEESNPDMLARSRPLASNPIGRNFGIEPISAAESNMCTNIRLAYFEVAQNFVVELISLSI